MQRWKRAIPCLSMLAPALALILAGVACHQPHEPKGVVPVDAVGPAASAGDLVRGRTVSTVDVSTEDVSTEDVPSEIEALAIGTELRETVRQRPEDWRRIIRAVRAVYSGQLTYAANWYREFEEVTFWKDLDFIGVQGYFPLTDQEKPTVEELRAGWQAPLERLKAVHVQTGLPVVFTEVGYKSMAGAAIEPWQWPRREDRGKIPVDLDLQVRCYEAFFQAVWSEPWIAGAYFWKWFPHHEDVGGFHDIGFTPQNKPAEQGLARWYRPG